MLSDLTGVLPAALTCFTRPGVVFGVVLVFLEGLDNSQSISSRSTVAAALRLLGVVFGVAFVATFLDTKSEGDDGGVEDMLSG